MTEYKLFVKDIGKLLTVVHELRANDIKQGVDFDFAWYTKTWENNDFRFSVKEASHGLFTFYNEELGVWFAMKYL